MIGWLKNRARWHLSAPLLVKELTERANRRQTYVIRVVFALLFYGVFGFQCFQIAAEAALLDTNILGTGSLISLLAIKTQLLGIFLFLPAMMSGAITHEKERGSLELLSLTGLSSRQIIVQKFIGGLAPMVTCLLMAVPMSGVAYALGGVTQTQVITGNLALLVALVTVGSFALMCSAYCRTTLGAFAAVYGLGALWFFGFSQFCGAGVLTPGHAFEHRPKSLAANIVMNVPPLISAVLFLLAAQVFLTSRAHVPRTNHLRRWFENLDSKFKELNKRFGGIEIVRDSKSNLPDKRPVLWRELREKSMTKIHWVVRLMLPIEAIVIVFGGVHLLDRNINALGGFSGGLLLLWLIALILIVVQGANLIASERANQTLSVLLTTPIPRESILLEKAVASRPMAWIALVPLITGALGEWHILERDALFFFTYLLAILIYPSLVFWCSAAVGLRQRSGFRGLLITFGIVATWFAVPVSVLYALESTVVSTLEVPLIGNLANLRPLALLSPVSFILTTGDSNGAYFSSFGWSKFFTSHALAQLAFVVNFAFHGMLALGLKNHCIRNAERYLLKAG